MKDLRSEKRLTHEDLDFGDDGIPYRTIQNIENGRSNPSLRTIYRLTRILQVKAKDIFDI
nr:helix-turn-helix transcriptional regulator [Leptospira broomii]